MADPKLIEAAKKKWEREQLIESAKTKWAADNSQDDKKSKSQKSFLDATIDDLPGLGAMTGATLGTLSPIPGGSLIGAGFGGYAGQAGKNLINTYRNPKEAPKSNMEYITSPLETGANSVTAEAVGQKVLTPAVELVGKGIKKGAEKGIELGRRAADYILKKGGNIVASVPEKYTEEYLKRQGNITARSSEKIYDEIQGIYGKSKESIDEAEKQVLERRNELQVAEKELSKRKQQFQDQFDDQKYTAGITAQSEKDMFDRAATVAKEKLKEANVVGLANRILDAIGRLKDELNVNSTHSYELLGERKGTISSRPLFEALNNGLNNLKLRGQILTATDQQAFQELVNLRDKLKELGGVITFPEAKFILQRLDQDTVYSPNAGAFSDVANAVKKEARKALDSVLKVGEEGKPYKKQMELVEAQTKLLGELSKKFGTPELAMGRLNNIGSIKGRHIDFDLLKQLGTHSRENFEKPLLDYIKVRDTLSSPSAMRALEESLPEYAAYKAAQEEQKRLAMPATRRELRERISKSEEQKLIQEAEKNVVDAQNKLAQMKEQFKPIAPFGLGSIQSKAKSLTGARDYAPDKLFTDLDQATGKQFSQEIRDRALLDSFLKSDTQGSRKTVMGAVAGKAIGTLLGAGAGYEAGGGPGATLGGMAGFSADKYAGRVLKFLLDRRINASQAVQYLKPYLGIYSEPLVKAAQDGPNTLAIVSASLGAQANFRRLMGEEPLEGNSSIQVSIPRSEYQKALVQLDSSKNIDNVEKAKAIDSLNRTGTIDSNILNKVILDQSVDQNDNQELIFEGKSQNQSNYEPEVKLDDIVNQLKTRKP